MATELTLEFDNFIKALAKDYMNYHNTVHLSGEKLKERQIKTGSQNEAILKFFQKYPLNSFTPSEVWKNMRLPSTPLTSIRRGISDLTWKFGKLTRTEERRLGDYGAEEYTWKIK
jgi:hypothetical protein